MKKVRHLQQQFPKLTVSDLEFVERHVVRSEFELAYTHRLE